MPDNALLVVLHFADSPVAELARRDGRTTDQLVGEIIGRALAAGRRLPLESHFTMEVPASRMLELVNGAAALPDSAKAAPKPRLPIKGLVHAVGAYVKATTGRNPSPNAGDFLDAFFGRFGIEIDYAGNGNG